MAAFVDWIYPEEQTSWQSRQENTQTLGNLQKLPWLVKLSVSDSENSDVCFIITPILLDLLLKPYFFPKKT